MAFARALDPIPEGRGVEGVKELREIPDMDVDERGIAGAGPAQLEQQNERIACHRVSC